jgi:protein ImuB
MATASSGKPDESPFVLVGKVRDALRITAADDAAYRCGLTIGMTLAEARARVPSLAVNNADPAADARLLSKLAESCEIFTPLVALDAPHGLLLDVTGCAHLFNGEMAMGKQVRRHTRRMGLTPRIAIAGTPEAAHVLARFNPNAIVSPGDEEEATRFLPITALEFPAETTVALTRAGLKTLGDLADRPSQILSARFGMELTTRLKRIMGHEDIRITPLRPPPRLLAEQHFAEPLLDADNLSASLKQLCDDICMALERRGLGGRMFEAGFFRSDGAVRRLKVETAQAMREAKSLLRLLQLRLDTLADPLDPGFGFDAIRMSVLRSEPLGQKQRQLDGKMEEDGAVGDLIDRLMTRFGRNRVLRFVARDTHDPVRAVAAVPIASPMSSTAWQALEPGAPPARPLRLFHPPQPIEAMAEVPDGPPVHFRWRRVSHQIAAAEGPERIAPEWWRSAPDAPTRDYYRVEDTKGHRFWVFREGLYDQDENRPRWFLHGLFA